MRSCTCPRCRERALLVQGWRFFIVGVCLRIALEHGENVCIELPPGVVASGANN